MTVGSGWAIGIDALCYVGAAVLLLTIHTTQKVKAPRSSMLSEIGQGWSAFVAQQCIWVIVLQFSLLNLCVRGGGGEALIGEHGLEDDPDDHQQNADHQDQPDYETLRPLPKPLPQTLAASRRLTSLRLPPRADETTLGAGADLSAL